MIQQLFTSDEGITSDILCEKINEKVKAGGFKRAEIYSIDKSSN